MRERIIALVGPDDGRKVEMGTFHAVCARILRRDGAAIGLDPRFVIYDTDDQLTLMKQVFRDLDMPLQGGPIRPRGVLEALVAGQERPGGRGGARRGGHDPLPGGGREARRGLRAAPPRGRRPRLRRPARRDRPAPRDAARGAGPLPGPLALPPRRRVPGHEPRPVPDRPRARRRAPQPVRGGRRRPVDLRLARARTSATSSTSSATSPARPWSSWSATTGARS